MPAVDDKSESRSQEVSGSGSMTPDMRSDSYVDAEKHGSTASSAPLSLPVEAKQEDPFLVGWDGPDDPANPQKWSFLKKATITFVWLIGNLVATVASSIFSSGATLFAKEFDVSSVVATLGTSLFIVGYAVGPPFWGPLSERYGRKWPAFVGNTIFMLFCLPVALGQNVQTVLIGRFFSGAFGAAPLAIVSGAMVDIWDAVTRGAALATCLGALFGSPILAPLMGNWIAQSYLGWRWDNWLSCIMAGAFSIVVFFLPETSASVILRRKAEKKRKETGDERYHSAFDGQAKGFKDIVQIYLFRSFRMMSTEPILQLITLYQAFVYGILYLVFVSYPIAWREVRHWSLGMSSLPYLGLLVGVLIGTFVLVYFTLTTYARQYRAGRTAPEQRLPLMILGAFCMPVGFFIYAWTSDPKIHWSGMVIGSVPLGMGLYIVFVQGFNFLIDIYLQKANSAIAANTFVRSFFGAGFPLFGPAMYHHLGVAWATSLLGFISIALLPIPIVFYKYGPVIRSWSKNSVNKS